MFERIDKTLCMHAPYFNPFFFHFISSACVVGEGRKEGKEGFDMNEHYDSSDGVVLYYTFCLLFRGGSSMHCKHEHIYSMHDTTGNCC